MKRFLLTSQKFTGTAEVWYNDAGLLARVDIVSAALEFRQIKFLLENVSPDIATFKGMLSGGTLAITEAPFEISVEDFCRVYPYSRNMHLVREWWPRQAAELHHRVYFVALDYADYCRRNASWYKPKIAITWLTKKEYLNNWKTL